MHTDIVTVQENNQIFVSTRQIAKYFNKQHHHVIEAVENIKNQYCDSERGVTFFSASFRTSLESLKNQENAFPRRGRPPAPEYWVTRDGFSILAMGFTGKKAALWKLDFLELFNRIEQTLRAEIPRLQAEVEQLRLNEKSKALSGSRTGMISAPVLTPNLWGEDEIVGWELRPKDTLDEYMLTLASLRHCNKVAEGLEDKKRVLTDRLVNEEMNRRASVTDLTERRFKLLKPKKNK